VQSIDDTTRAIQTKYVPLRKELYKYLEHKKANDRDEEGNIKTPDWNLENIKEVVLPEDMRYFSSFDLSLNPEFEFTLTAVTLHDFVASLTHAPAGHRAAGSRVGTNIDEMARLFKSPKSYTSEQLEQYQKKLFSVLNKRVSSPTTGQAWMK
jgi:hypothetical protein